MRTYGSPIVKGMRLEVPAVGHRTVKKGDSAARPKQAGTVADGRLRIELQHLARVALQRDSLAASIVFKWGLWRALTEVALG
jgi:hypothetical protein